MDATMADARVPQVAPLEPPIATSTAPAPDFALPAELVYALICNWKGQKLDVNVVASDTVGDLKAMLWSLTSVPVDRQKIVGLVKGKLPGDEAEVVSLGLLQGGGAPKPFMMIGTPEGEEHKEIGPTENRAAEVDIDYTAAQEAAHVAAQGVRNRRKLKETIDNFNPDIMNAPRPGKKLVVLDLDHCILDTTLWKEDNFVAEHFARPYLHEFLKAVSPYYDIVVWSQTSWRWLEQKLMELNMIGEGAQQQYNVVTTVDRKPMFSVYSKRADGQPHKHEVKALGLLWAKFPDFYSSANTIHLDDLSRNFAMNPKNGLKVKAYKDALFNTHTDNELVYAARYLLQLVNAPDFTQLDHSRFRKAAKYPLPLPFGVVDPLTWLNNHDNAGPPPVAPEGGGSGEGTGAGEGGHSAAGPSA